MALTALACTGDPLLDLMLARCSSFNLRQSAGETVADALREAEEANPALLFISPALGDVGPLLSLPGLRVCCLVEGTAPHGLAGEVLAAERLTPELVDAWVRRPARPASPPAPAPLARPSPPIPPPLAPEAPAAPATPSPRPSAAGVQPAPLPPVPRPVIVPPAPQTTRPRTDHPRPALSVLRQQVLSFWGGKPGAGRSTLAVALSDLLSRAGGIRICTVDLNPYNSSLAALVGKEQEVPSWFHLSEAIAGNGPFPNDALCWVKPNWAILAGPDGRPDWVQQVKPQSISWVVSALRTQFDYIILDPEARPGEIRDTAAHLAQTLLVTLAPDYPDVLDSTRAFEVGLEQGVIDRTRCRLVLNRWVETPHLPTTDVADCFGLPVSLVVPAAAEAVVGASSQGVPVTQVESGASRPLAQALGNLASLVAEPVIGTAPERGGLLRGLFGR